MTKLLKLDGWLIAVMLALGMLGFVSTIGCQSLYTGTVSLTKIVDSAAHEYASLYNQGLVPPDVAAKASIAHAEYRKAAGLAADALTAVKLGQTADTKGALEAAKIAAGHFVDIIAQLLTKSRTAELRAQIQKASSP